jgi:hypothetical protein
MPNYTLPVGPLQLWVDGFGFWGLFSITADNNDNLQFNLVARDGSTVGVNVGQQSPSDSTFNVTFTLNNSTQYGTSNATLELTGCIVSNILVNGICTITTSSTGQSTAGGLTVSGVTWRAGLLPIQAPIQIGDNNSQGTLAIDENGNLSYTGQGSSTPVALASVSSALDVSSGSLSQVTFQSPLAVGDESYTHISGSFTSSTAGSGTIGPHTAGGKRQSGDDTWTPILENK